MTERSATAALNNGRFHPKRLAQNNMKAMCFHICQMPKIKMKCFTTRVTVHVPPNSRTHLPFFALSRCFFTRSRNARRDLVSEVHDNSQQKQNR